MRQSHQKSRSRGRGRKPQNPLSRNYESNGPDVKIRGNASHIAEKYSTLARDAQSNGDTVMAENYFQHAEHYNRIVAAAQAQKAEEQAQREEQMAQQQANGRGPQPDLEEDGETNANPLNDEASEDASPADGEEAQAKPQKSGRNRRPRKPAAEAKSEANGAENGSTDTEVAASDDQPELPVEAISEDASKLPGSITGGFLGDDA